MSEWLDELEELHRRWGVNAQVQRSMSDHAAELIRLAKLGAATEGKRLYEIVIDDEHGLHYVEALEAKKALDDIREGRRR